MYKGHPLIFPLRIFCAVRKNSPAPEFKNNKFGKYDLPKGWVNVFPQLQALSKNIGDFDIYESYSYYDSSKDEQELEWCKPFKVNKYLK